MDNPKHILAQFERAAPTIRSLTELQATAAAYAAFHAGLMTFGLASTSDPAEHCRLDTARARYLRSLRELVQAASP